MNRRTLFLLTFTVASVLAAVLLPPMAQPLDYHDFADHRHIYGVENFLDVASNVAFVLAGLVGLYVTFTREQAFATRIERWPYATFFVGVVLTGLGSGWYHLAPGNESLFWDRLPMTIAFMSLLAAQVGDRVDPKAGVRLLLPALAIGAATVFFWRATERAGVGNVMPYGVLQGYAVVVLFLLTWLQPSRYTRGGDVYWVFLAYVLAKVLETFDREIYALLQVTSGHTLKHVAAAVGAAIVAHMLWKRRPQELAAQVRPAGGPSPAPAMPGSPR